MPQKFIVAAAVLTAALISGPFGAWAEGPAIPSMRICLAAGSSLDGWLAESPGTAADGVPVEVLKAEGSLVSSGAELRLESDAVAKGCDLVVAPDQSPKQSFYLLESAPDGPMADTRATVDLIAKRGIRLEGVLFTGGDKIDDQELIGLLADELDELASSHGTSIAAVPHYICASTCKTLPTR